MAIEYTKDKIEAVAAKLRDLPDFVKEKTEFSKKETILMLLKEIKDLQKRGYSLEQISGTLKGEGIDISTATLRSYVQQQQKKRVSKKSVAPDVTPKVESAVQPKKPVKTGSTGNFKITPDDKNI